jgi:signal transduction histidine kinase/CheY-like chemotaxis protein
MYVNIERENLRLYVELTYRQRLVDRILSVAAVAGVTVWLKIWDWPVAAVWTFVYTLGELAIIYWWRKIRSELAKSNANDIRRHKAGLIAIASFLSCVAAAPCFLTPEHGVVAICVGLLLSTATLMIIAAQHSLDKHMAFYTAPPMVIALLLNLRAVDPGQGGWLLMGLGVAFIGNAFGLSRGNARAYEDLLSAKSDAETATKSKSQFLANMSHEIRTPLNGVLGMAQAMALEPMADDQRERLSVIQTSGEALLAILDDLLDFSKIEAGRIEISNTDFDLAETIQSACRVFGAIAEEKGVRLNVSVDAVTGVYHGDRLRIRQIVQNLVSNAVKFTSFGSVTVMATVFNDGVSIMVRDTGVGIDPKGLGQLFEPFSQIDNDRTRKFGGTGLGLAIARDLARRMGGDIQFESRKGEGARFTLTLPLSRVSAAAPKPHPPVRVGVKAQIPAGGTISVLIAEDNVSNRRILESVFRHAPADCHFVENGLEALEAFRSRKFDLVLMDVQMPVMDGLTATRAIREWELDKQAAPTPIYAMTADAMRHQIASHLAAGMNGHLSKPLQVTALFTLIADIGTQALRLHLPPFQSEYQSQSELPAEPKAVASR